MSPSDGRNARCPNRPFSTSKTTHARREVYGVGDVELEGAGAARDERSWRKERMKVKIYSARIISYSAIEVLHENVV